MFNFFVTMACSFALQNNNDENSKFLLHIGYTFTTLGSFDIIKSIALYLYVNF